MVPSKHRSLDKFVCPVIFYERVHHFFIIFTSFSSRLLVLCSFCSSKLYTDTRVYVHVSSSIILRRDDLCLLRARESESAAVRGYIKIIETTFKIFLS